MLDDLSLLEKFLINCRAKKDVKRQTVERVVFLEKERALRKAVPDGADPNALNSSLYSPFVTDELSRFNKERDRRLERKRVHIWLYTKHHWKRHHWTRLQKGLMQIESQVVGYKLKINLLADQYSADLAELDRRRKHYEQTNELHMVQMCVNRAQVLRSAYAAETNDLYVGIVELLGQKLILLSDMDGRIRDKRARRYRRIRYYMGQVCTLRPALGPENMPDEVLDKYANTTILGDYETVRDEALSQQTHYNDEFNQVRNW